jgi:hypothetical protein
MSFSFHLRQNNARSVQQWVKAHRQRVRRTTHTTYDAEDAAEGHITSDTSLAQLVDSDAQPGSVSTIGHTRKFTVLVFVDEEF